MYKLVLVIALFLSAISCSNNIDEQKGMKTECLTTVKKLLVHLHDKNKDSVKAFYLPSSFNDSLLFDTKVNHASMMLLSCDHTKIDSAIVFADSSDMRIYSPNYFEYQLKLYTKSNEYLGEIIFSFHEQHCEKISDIFVHLKPSEIKVDIDFSGILDSNGNPLPQTWRERSNETNNQEK